MESFIKISLLIVKQKKFKEDKQKRKKTHHHHQGLTRCLRDNEGLYDLAMLWLRKDMLIMRKESLRKSVREMEPGMAWFGDKETVEKE